MKKTLITLLSIFVFSLCIQAQKNFELPLWESSQSKDDAADARVYVYLADNPTGQAIIICPGGAYMMLAMDIEGFDFAPWFNHNGISLIVLKYRLPKQRNLIPLTDAEQAMRLVRAHAKEWRINPHKVGIMGSSAGGHLASTLATQYSSNETRPDFQILLYPVITMDPTFTNWGTHNSLIGEKPSNELVEKFSNEKHVTDNTPPAFIVVSSADEGVFVKNSLVYTQALIDHKIPVSLHVYPGGFHGFGFNKDNNFKDADIWHKELLRWLKRNGN
jgi:acetyl esterase/lipase